MVENPKAPAQPTSDDEKAFTVWRKTTYAREFSAYIVSLMHESWLAALSHARKENPVSKSANELMTTFIKAGQPDLSRLLDECDAIHKRKYAPTKLFWGVQDGKWWWFAERVIYRAPDELNLIGRGATREQAAAALLDKLKMKTGSD